MYWTLHMVLPDYTRLDYATAITRETDLCYCIDWQCMNCVSFFTNVLQPNMKKKLGFEKVIFFAEMYYDRILNIKKNLHII